MLKFDDVLMALDVLRKENSRSVAYTESYKVALDHVADAVRSLPQFKVDESVWKDAKLLAPKKSGEYLVKWHAAIPIDYYWHYAKLSYSKRYGKWNCCDHFTEEEVKKLSIEIDYWTEEDI